MPPQYEVTATLRVDVQDAAALLAAARGRVPDEELDDPERGVVAALQALVPPSDVDGVPGVSMWDGLGWVAQVAAKPVDL